MTMKNIFPKGLGADIAVKSLVLGILEDRGVMVMIRSSRNHTGVVRIVKQK